MKTRSNILWIAATPSLLLAALGVVALAGTANVPHTFVPGEVADAHQVNANFAAIAGATNDNDHRISTLEARVSALAADLEERDRELADAAYMVQGNVAADGTVVEGHGFTVYRRDVGVYEVTYDTPFDSAPELFYPEPVVVYANPAPTTTITPFGNGSRGFTVRFEGYLHLSMIIVPIDRDFSVLAIGHR